MRQRSQTETAIRLLREARELITPFGKWCWGAVAQNSKGEDTSPTDRSACKWCAEGALHFVEHRWKTEAAELTDIVLLRELDASAEASVDDEFCIVDVNDGNVYQAPDEDRHKAVLACYDHTIERLEKTLDA